MNNFLKFALIGGGAFVLYEMFGKSLSLPVIGGGVPPAATSAATVQPQNTPAPAAVAAAATATTKTSLADAARKANPGGDGLLNADQWNYYYSQIRGVPGPDPGGIWPGRDRGYRMSIDEYWSAVSTIGGLTGLGNYAFGGWRRSPYLVN